MTSRIYGSLVLGAITSLLVSCSKDPAYLKATDSKENVVIYLKQGTTSNVSLQLFPFVDEARTLTINAGFGAMGYPANNVVIQLEPDTKALDSVNQVRINAGQQPYEAFPTDAYELVDRQLTIAAGTLTSNLGLFKYYPKKFDPSKNYLLPVSIKDASGYSVNPRAKTAFILAPKLEGKPASTEGWQITASTEQTQWENTGLATAVLDGNINTYWHSSWWPAEPIYPHWLKVDMQQEYYVDKIGLVPRQNNSNGFAKFNLEASRDGNNWTMVLEAASFDPTNKVQQTYALTPAPWRHFRLTMTEGRTTTAKSTHLAEWVVYKY